MDAARPCEVGGAGAGQEDVRRRLHDQTRHFYGVVHVFNGSHGTCFPFPFNISLITLDGAIAQLFMSDSPWDSNL